MNKRKNIVLLLGSYFPKPSAVGGCAEKIAKELAKNKNYSVTVISVRNEYNQSAFEVKDGYKIIRLSYNYFNIINDSNTSKLYKQFKRIIRNIGILFNLYSMDDKLSDLYLNGLETLTESIDVIIPFSFPIETLNASLFYKRKYKTTKIIPFIYDNYKNSQTLHKFNWNKKLKTYFLNKKELEFFESFDNFLMIHTFQQIYCSFLPSNLLDKIVFTEHPLLLDQFKDETDNRPVVVSYTGALLKGYVEADRILELIKRAPVSNLFNFYTFGNAFSKLENVASIRNNINFFNKIDKAAVIQVINNSDVLINISEFKGLQISSKIFEYMSAGKPIIQYSYQKECINAKILLNYPLALILFNSSGLESNSRAMNYFLQDNSKQRIPFEKVSNLYSIATPEHNVKILNEMMK